MLLYGIKHTAFNDWLVRISEDQYTARIVSDSLFQFIGLGISFEVHRIPTVELIAEHFSYSPFRPVIRSFKARCAGFASGLAEQIDTWTQNLFLLKRSANRIWA